MSLELVLLVWSVALTFIQMVIAVGGAIHQLGVPALVGNRENLPALWGWAGRAERAHRNMLESLVLFAVVVILADMTSRENEWTALGAEVFFWSRCTYAIVYIAGLPWLRTAVWTLSMVGIALIFVQLF